VRHTLFGDPVLHPGDDLYAVWIAETGEEPSGLSARLIEQDEGTGRWGCELSDMSVEMTADDFESEDDLRAWLSKHSVEIEEF